MRLFVGSEFNVIEYRLQFLSKSLSTYGSNSFIKKNNLINYNLKFFLSIFRCFEIAFRQKKDFIAVNNIRDLPYLLLL